MLDNAKYYDYAHKLRGRFADIDDYQYVQLPYVETRNGKKILYVLDYMPSEDLKSAKLLSGPTGMMLDTIVNVAQRLFLRKRVQHSWTAVTYNAFRTAGRPDDFRSEAHEVFTQRLHAFITKYKPDLIIGFGADVMRALIPHKVALDPTKLSYWLGVPIESTFKTTKREHTCTVTCSLSLDHMLNGFAGAPALLGYVARNVANGLNGDLLYKLDAERLRKSKPILIDTVAKFDKLLAMLKKQKIVSVDTEGISLAKITNKLLTVQFAKCEDYSYIIPMYHKDTPFNPKELRYLKDELRAFFEGDNENDYHIYCNAKFDLTFLRHQLEISHFANDVWDVQGGEFCFHPDTVVVTEIGKLTIRELLAMNVRPKVLSMNVETNTLEYKEVLFASMHRTEEKMYEIEYDGGTLRVTGNHKLWSVTRNAYIRADEIYSGEEVAVLESPDGASCP